jgi:hypothetical protein
MPPHGNASSSGELTFSLISLGQTPEQLRAEAERNIENIRQYLNWVTADFERFRRDLSTTARQEIEGRRHRLKQGRALVDAMGFPIRRRDDPAANIVIPVARKKVVPKLPETTKASPEPYLELAQYEDILETIQNMALVIERSPAAFQHLREEELRWLFLVPLNGLYEGGASGETFNFDGKTDILIRVSAKNIFVAECAIWNGPVYLKGKIDQLLGYATWRDSKLAIIIFNRAKDFSGVLAKMAEVCKTHPNFKRELNRPQETWFRCVIVHRDDPNRELTLTVLAFEVPS